MTPALAAHVERDPWPRASTLAFMSARADDQELTVACGVDVGGPLLCAGRVALGLRQDEGGEFLWPISGCSNGHPLGQVEIAYADQADAIGRGRPPPDPLGEFVHELARHAASLGIDKRALKLAIRRAGHAA